MWVQPIRTSYGGETPALLQDAQAFDTAISEAQWEQIAEKLIQIVEKLIEAFKQLKQEHDHSPGSSGDFVGVSGNGSCSSDMHAGQPYQPGAPTRAGMPVAYAPGNEPVTTAPNDAGQGSTGLRPLLDLIAEAEGTDRGRGYNETLSYGAYTGGPVNLTDKTLTEVLALQASMLQHKDNYLNSSAVGRYQIISTTLEGLIQELGLNPDTTKFTPEIQDRMAVKLLERRGLNDYLAGKMSREAFMANLAQEWTSFARESAQAELAGVLTGLKTGTDQPTQMLAGGMQWPAEEGHEVTSEYGMRRDPFTGKMKMHAGIDIGGPSGSPIVAARDGEVIFAGTEAGYGNVVRIKHADGTITVYAHLQDIAVGVGDQVGRGQEIATMGSTGRSTGPHLHFEVRTPQGQPVDPSGMLPLTA